MELNLWSLNLQSNSWNNRKIVFVIHIVTYLPKRPQNIFLITTVQWNFEVTNNFLTIGHTHCRCIVDDSILGRFFVLRLYFVHHFFPFPFMNLFGWFSIVPINNQFNEFCSCSLSATNTPKRTKNNIFVCSLCSYICDSSTKILTQKLNSKN